MAVISRVYHYAIPTIILTHDAIGIQIVPGLYIILRLVGGNPSLCEGYLMDYDCLI